MIAGIIVRCQDGMVRHPLPFASRAEADTWAEWAHACTATHVFEEVPAPGRTTPHQAEVLDRLTALYRRLSRPVRADEIGSRGAMAHLVEKGLATRVTLTPSTYRPVGEPAPALARCCAPDLCPACFDDGGHPIVSAR